MSKENYSITLEIGVAESAKKIMYSQGKKFSSVINNLLKDWLKDQEENKESEVGNFE